MATYSYKAKDAQGKVVAGVLDADTQSAAASRLQSMGFFPVSIHSKAEEGRIGAQTIGGFLGRRRMGAAIVEFNRQMADLIGSGIQLIRALKIVSSQMSNPIMKRVVEQLAEDVSGGETLADAMARHPRVFSVMAVAMVRAGEAGGMLDQVLERLAEFTESEDEVRGKVKSALYYPIFLTLAGIGAVIILMTVVIPKISRMFLEMEQTLPWQTQALISVSEFMAAWWWALGLGVIGGAFAILQFAKTDEGGLLVASIVLRMPLLGTVVIKRDTAGFCRTLGELVRNGVPILTAFGIAQKVVRNKALAKRLLSAPEAITQGEGVADALRQAGDFPPFVVNMIATGEETGRLPESLLRVASAYELQVDRSIKTLTSLVEPVIIMVMGLVVGAIVIAGLLPIFSLDPTGGG